VLRILKEDKDTEEKLPAWKQAKQSVEFARETRGLFFKPKRYRF
jgi:hypothetical protein